MQRMGQQRHPGVESHQTRCGAVDGEIRPLAVGFEAQMGTARLEGCFKAPALDEPWLHRPGPIVRAGREEGACARRPLGLWTSTQRRGWAGPCDPTPLSRWARPTHVGGRCPSARGYAARGGTEGPSPAAARARLAPAVANGCPAGASQQAPTRRYPAAAGPLITHPREHTPGPVREQYRLSRR